MDLSPTRSSFGKHGLRTIMLKKLRQKLADDQFGGLLVACRQRQAGNFSHLSSPSVEEAGSLPPNWYWWRSQFSCLASNEFKLRVSIIFDFATSTQIGQEAFHERNLYNYMGAFRFRSLLF